MDIKICVQCPTCNSSILASENRGIIINKNASLRAELISLRASKALWAPAKIIELEAELKIWQKMLDMF